MSGNGWISLHRSLQNHWLFTEKRKFSKFEAWVDLLLLMNHSDSKELFRDDLVNVKRGQHVTSIRKLCNRWGWSNNKVKNFFELLEAEHMAKIQSDTKKSLVTVINYDSYQKENSKKRHPEIQNEQKAPQKSDSDETVLDKEYKEVSQSGKNGKRQQSDSDATAMHTNNNVNNENNLNNLINNNNESPDSWLEEFEKEHAVNQELIREIEQLYLSKRGLDPEKPTKGKDFNLIVEAITTYTKDEILEGIEYAFTTSNNVYSFQYCVDAIVSLKEYKSKPKHQKKNVVPFNKQKKQPYNPASQLPKSIREADQNKQSEVENEMSPEEYAAFLKEFEAFKKDADERVKAYENY